MTIHATELMAAQGLGKTFTSSGIATEVLRDVSFSINEGEFLGIRGSNGSGKTTLFNIIAGVDTSTVGNLSFSSHRKPVIGVVFQNYASTLLPWLTAKENILLPKSLKGEAKTELQEEFEYVIDLLGFANLPFDKYPHQLSGGQQQKITIARGILYDPDLLILDEPFASLDYQTVKEIQNSLLNLRQVRKLSVMLVSHDIDHLIYLTDRVLLLNGSPSSIRASFEVPFGEIRNRSLLHDQRFAKLRNEILDFEYAEKG